MSCSIRSDSVVSRRQFFIGASAGGIALAGTLISPDDVQAAWPVLKEGDVFVTRNIWNNVVPGFWNHAALYSSGRVYEAQLNPRKIRSLSLDSFRNAYPYINVFRLKQQYLVPRMMQYAKSLVGKPYTIVPGFQGYNCVVYVRVSYYFATLAYQPLDPGWGIPDHIANDTRRFAFVGSK